MSLLKQTKELLINMNLNTYTKNIIVLLQYKSQFFI